MCAINLNERVSQLVFIKYNLYFYFMLFKTLKYSKPFDEMIYVKSNWNLNQTPLILMNSESKFSYPESSNNEVYDKVSENESKDVDIDDLIT